MSTMDSRRTLRELGEHRIVEQLIAPRFRYPADRVIGIGDDCAVIPSPGIGSSLVFTVQNRKGFAELMDLVIFTASQPSDVLQQKIQTLPEDWLKAYLWVYEVEGHGKKAAQMLPSQTCSK